MQNFLYLLKSKFSKKYKLEAEARKSLQLAKQGREKGSEAAYRYLAKNPSYNDLYVTIMLLKLNYNIVDTYWSNYYREAYFILHKESLSYEYFMKEKNELDQAKVYGVVSPHRTAFTAAV